MEISLDYLGGPHVITWAFRSRAAGKGEVGEVVRIQCAVTGLTGEPWEGIEFREISPGCSLEGLMLKLKLQYFGHLMRRADSFEKTLMLGKFEGRRRRGRTTEDEMGGWHHWLNGHGFAWTLGVGDGWGAWRATVRGVTKSQTWLSVELNWCSDRILSISLGNCGNLAVFCENFWMEISTVLKRLWRFSCLSRNHQTFWT